MRISDWSSDVCSSDLSSLRSAHDHPRNLDEGRLKALAAKGGAMCISTIYMSEMNMSPERAKLFGEYEHIGEMTPEAQAELTRQWRELDESEQMWAADFEDYMTMVLRAIEVGGVDHICFGADWDGGGGLRVEERRVGKECVSTCRFRGV